MEDRRVAIGGPPANSRRRGATFIPSISAPVSSAARAPRLAARHALQRRDPGRGRKRIGVVGADKRIFAVRFQAASPNARCAITSRAADRRPAGRRPGSSPASSGRPPPARAPAPHGAIRKPVDLIADQQRAVRVRQAPQLARNRAEAARHTTRRLAPAPPPPRRHARGGARPDRDQPATRPSSRSMRQPRPGHILVRVAPASCQPW